MTNDLEIYIHDTVVWRVLYLQAVFSGGFESHFRGGGRREEKRRIKMNQMMYDMS